MTNHDQNIFDQWRRLTDALSTEIDTLPDEDILREAIETYGSLDQAESLLRSIVSEAVFHSGSTRMAAARRSYNSSINTQYGKMTSLTIERKKQIIEKFSQDDAAFSKRATLAARNGIDSEADLDSLLEDLLRLGVIDPQGNPK